MTPAEYDAITALGIQMDNGFREIRGLMETRRLEEVRVQSQLEKRIATVEAARTASGAVMQLGKFLLSSVIALAAVAVAYLVR